MLLYLREVLWMVNDHIKVRNRVKMARIEKGNLTQIELAKKVGITRQTLNLIEAQKYNPSLKVCLLLSKYLEKSLDELFWLEENNEKRSGLSE
jgi:putative transcriptional regulator